MSSTYVLVHGAYHGGWCWQRVAKGLRDQGHRVEVLTHTGSGERAHLLREGLDLNTYVDDLIGLVEAEDLQDVILVGHSFGGYTVTGAADRHPERFSHLVYLDAAVPITANERPRDNIPAGAFDERVRNASVINGVRCFDSPPPEYFGISDETDREWVRRHLNPIAVSLFESSLSLRHPVANGLPVTYMRCTKPVMTIMESAHRNVAALGWPQVDLPTGHDAMISMPEAVVDALLAIQPDK